VQNIQENALPQCKKLMTHGICCGIFVMRLVLFLLQKEAEKQKMREKVGTY